MRILPRLVILGFVTLTASAVGCNKNDEAGDGDGDGDTGGGSGDGDGDTGGGAGDGDGDTGGTVGVGGNGGEGSGCTDNSECGSQTCISGMCADPSPVGGPCDGMDGLGGFGGMGGSLSSIPGMSDDCAEGAACFSGTCLGLPGTSCEEDEECAGVCLGDTCQKPSNFNELCDDTDDCESGLTCDETLGRCLTQACDAREAEHPYYTTENGDGALCGNNYTSDTIEDACGAGWHVCRESEWFETFPTGMTPDGLYSSFGTLQTDRCDLWEADHPESDDTYDVCDRVGEDRAYNPWNDGQFVLSDDGTEVLGSDGDCCDPVNTFESDPDESNYDGVALAVFCCR